MISHDYKFVFIHIPKTGGTSIEKGLLDCGVKTRDFKFGPSVHYDIISEYVAKNYFIFAVHRNPWDRFVSLWRYWMFTKKVAYQHNLPLDFAYFCYNINYIQSVIPKIESVHFLNQIEINGQPSYVKPVWLDFKRLDYHFKNICDYIGIQHKPLKHYNATKHDVYTEYYDKTLIDYVYKKYKEDILFFQYEYGS